MAFLMMAGAVRAAPIDLSVSAYTQAPDPVSRGGAVTLDTVVTNNDSEAASSGDIQLVVELPSNVDFSASATPSGCVFDLGASPKTLSCVRTTPLAAKANWLVSVKGKGLTTGAVSTRARVAFLDTDTDPEGANDELDKNITVKNGANLGIAIGDGAGLSGCPGACAAEAGANVSVVLRASNVDGPDTATGLRVVANLPATTDFTFASYTGSGWNCSRSGSTLTCNYTGPALAPGASAEPVVVSGRIIRNSSGTVTFGASIASADNLTGDPVDENNGPRLLVVDIKPGTNLQAVKTMTSVATGRTVFVSGEQVRLTLAASNTGTQAATGVRIVDTIAPGFTIGTLPADCSLNGTTVTCSVPGTLAAGASSASFVVPLTVTDAAASGTNVASVSRGAPAGGSNADASVAYTISVPFAHLTLSKSKAPGLAAAGTPLTSTIRIANASTSTSAASGTVTVRDTLAASETFIPGGSGTNGWSCSAGTGTPQVVTCTYAIPGTLARGAALPDLIVMSSSSATGAVSVTNRACTGLGISSHTPADNASACGDATTVSTVYRADLGITKSASTPSLTASDNALSYTLTVTNTGQDTAPTVSVQDTLPVWYDGDGGRTSGSAVLAGATAGESCNFASTVSCVIRDLPKGGSRTITINLQRPFASGVKTNTATVSTQDAIDEVPTNNKASATVDIAPVADVQVAGITAAPSPVKVGVALTYTTSISNNGPSTATGVVVRHLLRRPGDPVRVRLSGTPGIANEAGATCRYTTFGDGDYAGGEGIECTNIELGDGERRQLVFSVIPVFPYPDTLPAMYATAAQVSTTVHDRNTANDKATHNAPIEAKQLDLTVAVTDTGYESLAFGEQIRYQVKVQNNGPSQATVVKLVVRPQPPAQNGAAGPYTMSYNAGASSLDGASCAASGADLVCHMAPSPANSTLPAGDSRTLVLAFDTGPATNGPLGSLVFVARTTIESAETGPDPFAEDTQTGNNKVSEQTTQKPRTNLFVASKSVSAGSPFSLNEPFSYTVVIGNIGPSPAVRANFTDLLPQGLVLNGPVTATLGSGTLETMSCTPGSSGGRVQVSCVLGTLPVAASTGDAPNLVTVTIPVRAPRDTYRGPFDTDIVNTAQVAVDSTLSTDPDRANDSVASPPHRVAKSSIAGSVYNDANRDNAMGAGEKIAVPVAFVLSGKDAWNNDIGLTVNSSGGEFLFDHLPTAGPAGYTIVQTQPAGYSDRFEVAGSAGGTVPPATCDGAVNCSAQAAHNTIGTIALPKNTAATGYLFQEYQAATVSGAVYSDLNNNGIRESGEPGIPGVKVNISGTTFTGENVCTALGAACTATTDASGQYTFAVPPSQADGYTVTEQALPDGYFDGQDSNGGTLVPSSAGRNGAEPIAVGEVHPGAILGERNFGELKAGTLGGSVFIDLNKDAVRQANELGGVPGVAITLGGLDYLGNPVCPTAAVPSCRIVTDGSGNYLFAGLPPSDATGYTVTETMPAGLTHIGAQAGSLGGTIAGAVRTSGTGVPGATVNATSAIALAPGQGATDYHFAESGQSLGGFVWADTNNNGIRDAGEPGIAGVQITLSGTTVGNADVCSAIAPNPCSTTTVADGSYGFLGIPQSSAAGYTLTETQPTGFADGKEQLGTMANGGASGTISGPAGTRDQFSGIVLPVGGVGTGYNFGEQGARITGKVYLDVDASGTDSAGDVPLAGVVVTLSGTSSGTTITGADGGWQFAGLQAGTYTVTEAQPAIYGDATTTAGSAGGNAATPNVVSAITVTSASSNTGYLFGEKAARLGGTVYVDTNGNGIRDAGEPGIAGVSLTLAGNAADGTTTVERVASTLADGSYAFTGLPTANGSGYTLTETQPAAYLDGKHRKGQVDGTDAGCAEPACDIATANIVARIRVDATRVYTRFDFGEIQAAQIGGKVYADSNDNATPDAGEALAGVTLVLSGTDDRGQPVATSEVSGADGSYTFKGLRPSGAGGYTVTETQPAAYGNFPGNSGTATGTLGGTAAVDAVSGIAVTPGASGIGYDFRETASSIAGSVYYDNNGNGLRDADEKGIAGVTVALADGAALSRTSTTGADGSYDFVGLPAGVYTLTETQPGAADDGKESAGSAGGTVDNTGFSAQPQHNRISAITLPVATKATAYLFGERTRAAAGGTLGGRVYVDANDNGRADAGEGLGGVVLTLSGNDRTGGALVRSARSEADGSYAFTNVPAADATGYTVTETHPVAYADYPAATGSMVGQVDGTASGAAAPNAIGAIRFGANAIGTNYDFRETGATLSGLVYLDGNDDGKRSVDEPGLGGVALTLAGPAGLARTAASAPDGTFRFAALPAGSYTLVETQPTGYRDGRETAGNAGGSVNNASFGAAPPENTVAGIVLAAGGQATGYLFGERPTGRGAISGRVYADDNDNGRYDSGEEIAGATLRLSGKTAAGEPVALSALTGADGNYGFPNLGASDTAGYTVDQDQPPGFGDYPGANGTQRGIVAGRALGTAALNRVSGIVLAADGVGVNYDFRERGASLAGSVYVDRNDDGQRSADEEGVAGVVLSLNGDGISRTATTDPDGGYRFGALPAGTYTLVENQPEGFVDGRETAGAAGGVVDNGAFGAAPAQNRIERIALPQATHAAGYLFGERRQAGSLAGRVYLDANRNGVPDKDEAGISGVTMKLGGTAADGGSVALTASTNADGGFEFPQVPASGAGGYVLTQLQPAGVEDGATTSNGNGRTTSSKPVDSGNMDSITGIAVGANDRLTGYLFGETPVPMLKPPIVNGYVWLDRDHNRQRPLDGSHAGLAGWRNELWQGDKLVCTTTTDSRGFYQFDNLRCPGYEHSGLPTGGNFSIVFRKDGNNLPAVPVSTGNKGEVPSSGGRITNIRLAMGEAVVEQNLPLDPAGVVYDSVTRKPVPGAVVALSGPAGFDPATQLVGGLKAERQTVGEDGMYQFLLQNGFPSGVYTLSLTAPASGYLPAPSTMLPACRGTLRVGPVPDPALIQAQDGAPPASSAPEADPERCTGLVQGGARTTQYYFSFHITNGGSAPILNNHLPLDPQQGAGLVVTKTTPMVNVSRGDLVPYTITASNRQPSPSGAVLIRDEMPPGFKYRSGSATRDGVPAEPEVDGRLLTWREPAGIASEGQRSYKLILMVGSGVGDGEYTNRAWAANLAGTAVSGVGSATVRLTPDATFDCPDIIGKVFDDGNANGYQDDGEAGIAGVRLATPRGLLVTTDKEGRFHVACPDVPNADRGSNFVMKLDDRTLPSGYRMTTENPRDVRLTRGKLTKLNFGATVHRVVRLELSDAAFEAGAERLLPQWQRQIDTLVQQLKTRPSVARIAYGKGSDGNELVLRRIALLEQELRRRWKARQDGYPLVIEVEGAQ